MNRTGFRCGRLLRVRTNEARMSGPRASGSQTCKPSFALLHHEVAPRADKSIRVHERHDNRQGRSPPDAFPLVARTNRIRDLWVMSQPVAVTSHLLRLKRAGHEESPGPAITPRLTPPRQSRRVSVPNPFPTLPVASAAASPSHGRDARPSSPGDTRVTGPITPL